MKRIHILSSFFLLLSWSLNAQINIMSCDTINFAENGECHPTDFLFSNVAVFSDTCNNDSIFWKVYVDIWTDGLFEYEFSSFIDPMDEANTGDADQDGIIEIYLPASFSEEQIQIYFNENIIVSGFYHSIIWIAYDTCGNQISCTSAFQIFDNVDPILECIDEDYIVITTDDANDIELDLDIVILSVSDNCSPEDSLVFTLDDNPESANLTFSVLSDDTTLELQVFDEKGNSSKCDVDIDFIAFPFPYDGKVISVLDESMSNVLVEIEEEYPWDFPDIDPFQVTDSSGLFIAFVSEDFDYSIQATFNDGLNGLSTRDIILLEDYIENNSTLNSPLDIIACDVDNNFDVDAQDVIYLSELLLEENTDTSLWKFLDAAIEFEDDNWPFPYEEGITHVGETDWQRKDLTGVKLGDINHSAIGGEDEKSAIVLSTPNVRVEKDEIAEVVFSFSDSEDIEGFQFSLIHEDLEFVDLTSDYFGPEDIAVRADLGNLWISIKRINNNVGPVDFTIKFKAEKCGELGKMIKLSESLEPQVYIGDSLKVHELELIVEGEVTYNEGLDIVPNPFLEETNILFELENSSLVYFSIYDNMGRLVREMDGIVFPRGKNSFILNKHYFISQYSGMYLLKMMVDDGENKSSVLAKKFFLLQKP